MNLIESPGGTGLLVSSPTTATSPEEKMVSNISFLGRQIWRWRDHIQDLFLAKEAAWDNILTLDNLKD